MRWTRCSAATAYLDPIAERANLEIRIHALATRIELEGRTAVGVHYERDGTASYARARREVLLCAGPGTSLRAPVGHCVLLEGWRGIRDKAALFASGLVATE